MRFGDLIDYTSNYQAQSNVGLPFVIKHEDNLCVICVIDTLKETYERSDGAPIR